LLRAGDARLDNKKFKAAFGGKARMLGAEEVLAVTGHPIGGVCPFGLATPLPVYCDVSLKTFDEVVPAAGSATVHCGSIRCAWPNWRGRSGWMFASRWGHPLVQR